MTNQGGTSNSGECKLKDLFKDGSGDTTNLDPGVWLKDLRDKIYSMFRTPLREEYNEEVFKWISALCMCQTRFSWLCSDHDKWTKEEAKMFSLITRLSINELHILLPRIRRHLTSGDEIDMEDGKIMARPANVDEYNNFGIHLLIFEETILALVHGQDDEASRDDKPKTKLTDIMEPNELKSLLERLKEIVGELFDYLENVHKHWTTLSLDVNSLKFQAAQGALRAVSVWLSEDAGSFQCQCKRFFIELIVRHLMISHQLPDTNLDLLIMALHAICSDEQDMKKVLTEEPNSRSALQKYLDQLQTKLAHDNPAGNSTRDKKRKEKQFKLQCGLVKDLLT